MIRAGLILAAILFLALAARGDGIWSGGGVIGGDGIANTNAIGANGISGINAIPTQGGGGACAGVIDASTGCPMPMLGGA
jgi:hypothetical protein